MNCSTVSETHNKQVTLYTHIQHRHKGDTHVTHKLYKKQQVRQAQGRHNRTSCPYVLHCMRRLYSGSASQSSWEMVRAMHKQ